MTRSVALTVGLLVCCACAPALRTPLDLSERGGDRDADPQQLAEQARAEFATRDPEAVRRAMNLWLSSAAGAGDATGALVNAIRAGVWLVERESAPESRRELASAAVRTGQRCEQLAPEDPRCWYWLAVAVGVQARERRSTALDGLDVMIDRLQRAIVAAPRLEHAGPHRVLALVYLRAPGWPTGPGDPDLALEHARIAARLEPSYPPNLLAEAEALTRIGETGPAREAYSRALAAAEAWTGGDDAEVAGWIREAREGRGAGS